MSANRVRATDQAASMVTATLSPLMHLPWNLLFEKRINAAGGSPKLRGLALSIALGVCDLPVARQDTKPRLGRQDRHPIGDCPL